MMESAITRCMRSLHAIRRGSAVSGLVCLGLMVIAVGCGGASYDQYVPAEGSAKSAVEVMLQSWKGGQAEGDARQLDGKIGLKCLDQDWRSGKRLANFEVLEVVPATAPADPRQVKARLTYEGEAQPVETVYFVVGIDPLWIFRQEDYAKTGGG